MRHFTSAATVGSPTHSNIDAVIDSVTSTIIFAADRAILHSLGSARWWTVPWWSSEIAEAIRERR